MADVKVAEFKPTHFALRPIKRHDKVYAVGALLQLDEEEAANLGITAVAPYFVPVEAMTAAQLTDAAKDAKAREKAEADEAKALADDVAKAAADAQKEAAK